MGPCDILLETGRLKLQEIGSKDLIRIKDSIAEAKWKEETSKVYDPMGNQLR